MSKKNRAQQDKTNKKSKREEILARDDLHPHSKFVMLLEDELENSIINSNIKDVDYE